jgi:tRNA A-37 threonylcarbamoyl transferase component Bud32
LFRGSDEEDKRDSLKFNIMDSGINKGNQLFEQLGNKFIKGEQQLMSSEQTSLLFSIKNKNQRSKYKLKKCKKIGDFIEGFIEDHGGDNDEIGSEPDSSSYEESKNSRQKGRKHRFRKGDSNESDSTDPDINDFFLIKLINKGGFGKVFLSKNKQTGKYYAMKRIRKDLLIETGQINNTLIERELLLTNDNPFLLKMHYVFQSEFRLYFFMEYVNGGNLYENMWVNKRFNEEQVKFFAAQLIIALGYLHNNNVIHRDLKPENVLLREDGYIVLADFGLAKILDSENDVAKTYCGTSEYMAPEIIKGHKQSFTVDWWTLGILVYELICGRSPFKDKEPRNQRRKIQNGKSSESKYILGRIPWPVPEKHHIYISKYMKDFITSLLEKNPKDRLGSKGVGWQY